MLPTGGAGLAWGLPRNLSLLDLSSKPEIIRAGVRPGSIGLPGSRKRIMISKENDHYGSKL